MQQRIPWPCSALCCNYFWAIKDKAANRGAGKGGKRLQLFTLFLWCFPSTAAEEKNALFSLLHDKKKVQVEHSRARVVISGEKTETKSENKE